MCSKPCNNIIQKYYKMETENGVLLLKWFFLLLLFLEVVAFTCFSYKIKKKETTNELVIAKILF